MANILNLLSEETFAEKMDNLIIAIHGQSANSGGHTEIKTWKQVQDIVRAGLAPKVFAIGDQLLVNRETALNIAHTGSFSATLNNEVFLEKTQETGTKDFEFVYDGIEWHDEHGNGIVLSEYGISVSGTLVENDKIVVHETAEKIAFDIIGFDVDTPSNEQFTHSMTLQCHDMVQQSFQFKQTQLLHYVKDNVLPAGTYNFTLIHGQYGGGTANDGTYQFTTTRDIPVGGGFRIDGWGYWESSYNVLTKKIKTYDANGNVLETLTITSGSGGTSLGNYSTRSADMTADELTYKNSIEKQGGGDNYYLTSDVRRYMNSKAKDNWWAKQTIFDLPHNSKTIAGFMHGIDGAFLSVVGTCKKDVKSDTVWHNKGTEYFEDKFFLLSNKEIRFTDYADEGVDYKYWVKAIPTPTNSANENRIKYYRTTPYYWWTRTCHRGHGNYEYRALPTGAYIHFSAYYNVGVVPACVIF